MPELAKAYVQIIPTTKGIKGQLTEALGGEADYAGQIAGEKAGASFGSIFKAVATVGVAAVTAAAAGVTALAKEAVSAYADYEQLIGGVETLFKDSADVVQQYASNAYKTAGLSANQYMETVTSFSASLLQSLDGDTKAAASVADMAITDMADNANKMGSSMESIQNAYQGFAKQNYTMLDNLKLGYGGTKTEMERLLADATELSGVVYDIDSLSVVYEAIHVIQTELDITGTTAREAGNTISGSLGMLSTSWQNLIVGIANPDADIGALISDVVSSAQTALSNLLPVIQTALSGAGQLVTGLAPVIIEALPGLITDVLPGLLNTAISLLKTAANAIINNLPILIPAAVEVVLEMVDTLTDPETLGSLVDAAIAIIIGLADGLIAALPKLLDKAPVIIENLVNALIINVPKLLKAGYEVIVSLVSGIIENLPKIGTAAGEIITTLIKGYAEYWDAITNVGRDIVLGIWNGIVGAKDWFLSQVKGFFSGIIDGVKRTLGIASPSKVFAGIGANMVAGVGVGIEDNLGLVEKAVGDMSDAAMQAWDADLLANAGSFRFGASGAAIGARTNTVTVTVNGAPGQDVRELAREVERVITQSIRTKEAAWA